MTAPESSHGRDDCVAGVIGLEPRNPSGSESARVDAGIFGELAKTPQQRLFAFELRRWGCAAAAGISADVASVEGRTASRRGFRYARVVGFELRNAQRKNPVGHASFCTR